MRQLLLLIASLVVVGGAQAAGEAPPGISAVAPGIWLLPGGIRPDRQPDGNTVIFKAPAGLIVFPAGAAFDPAGTRFAAVLIDSLRPYLA